MSVMALDHARSTFYVVQTTSGEFGLPSDNKQFITQNEARISIRLNICHILLMYLSIHRVQ